MALACMRCGVVLFVLILLFVATCAHRSIMLLMRVSERLQLRTCKYPDLGRRLFGTRGEYACALSVILQQTGACIAYVVIIADTLVPILKLGADSPASLLCDRWPWQVLIVGTVIFPLCLLRQMESLKYTSFVALAFILSFTLAVVGVGAYALHDSSWRMDRYLEHHKNGTIGVCPNRVKECAAVPTNHIAAFPTSLNILNALPIICFAFLCHMNAFPIRNELKDPTLERMGRVSLASMLTCAAIYFMSGAFGYFAFTDSTLDNLMLNFVTSGNTLAYTMDVLRVGFGLALIFSFPVIIYEAREGIVHLFFQHSPSAHTPRFHFLLNLAMVSFACLIGILVPQIDTIFGIVGSTATPMIVFILPAALWLQVRSQPTPPAVAPRLTPAPAGPAPRWRTRLELGQRLNVDATGLWPRPRSCRPLRVGSGNVLRVRGLLAPAAEVPHTLRPAHGGAVVQPLPSVGAGPRPRRGGDDRPTAPGDTNAVRLVSAHYTPAHPACAYTWHTQPYDRQLRAPGVKIFARFEALRIAPRGAVAVRRIPAQAD